MKIESIIRREGGSRVLIDNTEYHFAPNDKGQHVAEVADEAHAERFLSIDHGYRRPSDDAAIATAPQTPEQLASATERQKLVEQYVEKFNKKPHHALSIEKLREQIANGIPG